jgi:hypothetical protein
MSGKQFALLTLLVVMAGFLGGWLSARWLPVSRTARTISSGEYHLVDAAGVRRASFEINLADEPCLILRDQQGNRRAILSFTENGEPVWSAATDSLNLGGPPMTVNLPHAARTP